MAEKTLQVILFATIVTMVVVDAAVGVGASSLRAAAEKSSGNGLTMTMALKEPSASDSASRFPVSLVREKRRAGWGRRPGLRYSKATSAFDFDNTFNKLYNKYEKRGQSGPESPISNFRELRMKQKVPNAQLLLPHLFNRNNRVPDIDGGNVVGGAGDYGLDVETTGGRPTEEEIDALMFLLEEYAKNIHNEQQQ